MMISDLVPISLLHATRGRAGQAIKTRDKWLRAAEFPERVEHIFAFDRDDLSSVESLCAFRHVIVEERDKGCVAAWNLAARASKGSILLQLSDDWLPIRKWDSKITARFRDTDKPGVLRVSDGRRVDDLLCLAIFTRAYLDLLGGDFLAAEYFGVYSDDEFSLQAYQKGVVIDARDIVFEHLHPSFFPEVAFDTTHARQNEKIEFVRGRETFLRRNPTARGHWLHEGTEQRYYLPPGHYYAQNITGPSVLAPSPLGRLLPPPSRLPPDFSYQVGHRSASRIRILRWLRFAASHLLGSLQALARRGRQIWFRSTLWNAKKDSFDSDFAAGISKKTIPVFIIHHQQPHYLQNMVTQLRRLGVRNEDIVVIDNASGDEASSRYLDLLRTERTQVIILERNFGPHEIFAPESGIRWPSVFALTDPDLEFDPRMPRSFREDFLEIALACGVWKCGCAISLDDAHLFSKKPYLAGRTIEEWERQYWVKKHRHFPPDLRAQLDDWNANVFDAPLDTTFAVYLRDAPRKDFKEAVRVSGVFACRHLPWYGRTGPAGVGDDVAECSGAKDRSPSEGAAYVSSSSRRYFSTTERIRK